MISAIQTRLYNCMQAVVAEHLSMKGLEAAVTGYNMKRHCEALLTV